MKFEKADPAMVKLFDEMAVGPERGAEKRMMFGYPCRFMNGNMFMGMHGNRIILRLSEEDRANFVGAEGGKPFEPMPGRIMKEYVVVPEEMLSKPSLKSWIERSASYAQSLPAKSKEKKARPGLRKKQSGPKGG